MQDNMEVINQKIPLEFPNGIELYIKREDLLHPIISGNKFRKLKYNLLEAKRLGFKKLLTFGGAFSNHIVAVAGAGKEFGFETI
jgi:1-aminocyclopropane-1-carboxylate deaminase